MAGRLCSLTDARSEEQKTAEVPQKIIIQRDCEIKNQMKTNGPAVR